MSSLAKTNFARIPRDELAEFTAECDNARRQVLRWLGIISEVDKAPKGQRGDIVKTISRRIGKGASTINRKRSDYKRSGWSSLINRSKYPKPNTCGLPQQFRLWVPSLFMRYQRKNGAKQVHRHLLDRLNKWRNTLAAEHALPGYDSPPADGPDGHPVGWSYRRICDLKPSEINLVTSRQGRKAAASLLPSNFATRAGLKFGQRIFFDDQQYDLKVNLLGRNTKSMRPMGFNALDHLSASFVNYTAKMTIWDDEQNRSRELKQKDFTWFALQTLMQTGYRTDDAGTEFIFEHGTATGWKGFDDALHHVTGGHVTVTRSGRFNDPMFAGMLFRPSSTGNYKYKAPLESIFNLVRNQMAALPGPMGQHFELSPEELHGMDAYNRQLLKLYSALPEQRRELIRFPFLNWQEFLGLLPEIYHLIDNRTDHKLEGWEQCGHVINRFRVDPSQPWQDRDSLLKLSPERSQAIGELAEWRVFPMTPAEVRAQGLAELTKLKPSLIPLLVPFDWAVDIKVKENHSVKILDTEASGEAFHYINLPQIDTADGPRPIKPGTKLKAHFHPIVADRIWIMTLDGKFLGCADLFIKPTAGDTPSIVANQGRINQVAAEHNRWTERYLGSVRDTRQKDRDHNKRLANGEAVTSEERRDVRSAKTTESRAANFGHDLATVTPAPRHTDDTTEVEDWTPAEPETFTEPSDHTEEAW